MKSLLDAETGQRGFLLTDRKEYLRPYHQAVTETRSLLAWLTGTTRADATTGAGDDARSRARPRPS